MVPVKVVTLSVVELPTAKVGVVIVVAIVVEVARTTTGPLQRLVAG